MTYTQFGSTASPSDTSTTGMLVAFDRRVVSALSWLGSRCWISTNAIPDLDGSALRSAVKAARPPAEAPMATTGNESPGRELGVPSLAPLWLALLLFARAARDFGTAFLWAICEAFQKRG